MNQKQENSAYEVDQRDFQDGCYRPNTILQDINARLATLESGSTSSSKTTAASSSSLNIDFGSAPPGTGSWPRGWIRFNTNPVAGGNAGWVCISGGNPGTWNTFGQISDA